MRTGKSCRDSRLRVNRHLQRFVLASLGSIIRIHSLTITQFSIIIRTKRLELRTGTEVGETAESWQSDISKKSGQIAREKMRTWMWVVPGLSLTPKQLSFKYLRTCAQVTFDGKSALSGVSFSVHHTRMVAMAPMAYGKKGKTTCSLQVASFWYADKCR